MEGNMWFKKGDKQASRPAPCIAKSASDVDDFGWPKAPIEGGEVSEEVALEIERKRQDIIDARSPSSFPKPFDKQPVPLKSHMTQEEFDELDYPKVPEEWNEEWMREQIEKERVDPRENPNLLFDECHQEFWFNASRKPYAKAILRSEQHWVGRRNVWLKQYENIEKGNQLREAVAEELEDCTMEVKRLVTPILHHKITEIALKTYIREAEETQIPLPQLLQDPVKLKELRGIRQKIDVGGDKAAAQLLDAYTETINRCVQDKQKEKEEANRGKRINCDTDTITKAMNMGEKFRKDGYIEWHKGNVDEALAAWRHANLYLKRFKLPDDDIVGNKMIADLHITILKNMSQAAIKLGYWTEALEAAEDALRIDDQDHKAWFRKACALEGLGRFDEEEEALAKIDDLAVGRVDRDRIEKDLKTRRTKIQALSDHDDALKRRGVARALARGVFSEDREAKAIAAEDAAPKVEDQAEAAEEKKAECPFKEGDAIVVRKTIADLERGLKGTVVEVDADGDVRIKFEGQDDVEMLLGEDLGHLVKDTGEDLDLGSSDEEETPALQDQPSPPGEAQDQPPPAEKPRKRLTKDSAADLLEELRNAYEDTVFRKQVAKLARDVRWDKTQFVHYLRKVALEVQRPVLEKWGFEASAAGVAEVELALLDHTRGQPETGEGRDSALKEKADAVTRLLYGEMYEVVFFGGVRSVAPPARAREDEDEP